MTILEPDSRRRTSLGKVGRHDRYIVHEEPDGALILDPAVVVSELDARFLANPALVQRIEASRKRPERPERPEARPRRDEAMG
jgi:hypothetical protein